MHRSLLLLTLTLALSSTARLLASVLSSTELAAALSSGPAALLGVPVPVQLQRDGVDDDLSRALALVSSVASVGLVSEVTR